MKKIGVIGTSAIVSYFCDCAHLFDELILEVVLSRSSKKGEEFAKINKLNFATDDYNLFLSKVDIVYIASPNSVHYSQAKQALIAKKHLIIEKPMTTKVADSKKLYKLAKDNNVFIMEAITTLSNPLLETIKNHLIGEQIQHIDFKMMQQSSRYQQLINHQMTNVFDKNMGGGAGYDLGVYLNAVLIALVGKGKKTQKYSYYFSDFADTSTTYIHEYDNFLATLTASKVALSNNYNQIITTNKTITFDSVSDLTHVLVYSAQGKLIDEVQNHVENRMFFELKHFLDVLASGNYVSEIYTEEISLNILKIIENTYV